MATKMDAKQDSTASSHGEGDQSDWRIRVAKSIPQTAHEAVLVKSVEMPKEAPYCHGYDFNKGINYDALLQQFKFQGFQGTNLGLAIEQINKMLKWRLSDEPIEKEKNDSYKDPEVRKKTKCTIFFSYTSNMISCGNREIIRFLCEHKLVDVIVTTAGGIEEDFMKCFEKHYMGDFRLKGSALRKKGLNRIGNLLVPNDNYSLFEDWMIPVINQMLHEQQTKGTVWSPSKMIHRMGKEINNPESVYYWCWKNDIPVYCPAITDGSIGDMVYFHSFIKKGLVIDIASDIIGINDRALHAKKTGMIILGGGLIKHHVCNANLMRNGADFSVFVNTGQEFDGSDSGARPDEAISWGKIRIDAKPVKVYADASLVFPIIAAQTFAKQVHGDVTVVTNAAAKLLMRGSEAPASSVASKSNDASVAKSAATTTTTTTTTTTESRPLATAQTQERKPKNGHSLTSVQGKPVVQQLKPPQKKKPIACTPYTIAPIVVTSLILLAGILILSIGFGDSEDCYVCYGRGDHETASTLAECEALHDGSICQNTCAVSSDPYTCNGDSFSVLIAFGAVFVSIGFLGMGCTLPIVYGRSLATRIRLFMLEEANRQEEYIAHQEGAPHQYYVYGNL